MARRLPDGFIISDTQRVDDRIDFLIDRGVPFVALGRSRSGGRHAWLDLDVAGQAVARLASPGHRRIALGTMRREVNQGCIFEHAYHDAMRAHGLRCDPALVVRVSDAPEGGCDLADALLAMADRPTAVVLLQETTAIGLYRRLGDAGLRPGHDLAVIGFRENRVTGHLMPALSCFRVSLRDYGARLGATIVGRIKAGPSWLAIQELWAMTLSPGGSDPPLVE